MSATPKTILTGEFAGLRFLLTENQTQTWAGLYEREVYRWLRKLARGAKSAVDVGADCGLYTTYFLKRGLETVAIEPRFPPRFHENLRLNGVDPARLALREEFITSLDGLCGVACPCVVKMDIDGPEADLLAASPKFLGLADVRWIIETHSPESEAGCESALRSHGYRTRIIPNAWWRAIVKERRPIPHNRWLVAYR